MRVILLILTAVSLLFGAYTRDATLNTVYDDETSLTWQDEPYTAQELDAYDNFDGSEHGKVLQWANAIDYCEDLDFAGVQDWRLPNFNELYMIADRSTYNPAMHMDAVNGFQNVTSGNYWSSTTYASDSSGAWAVYFGHGYDYWNFKTGSYYVRCVRSGQIAPLNTSPVAIDDSFSTSEDVAVSGNVITSMIIPGVVDSDPEGDPLHVSVWGTPTNGVLSATDSEGNFTYTPNLNYSGTDTFEYTLSDGSLEDNATVQITVGAVNDIPVITEGTTTSVTMSEDANPTAFALTLNATDGDGDVITWSIKTQASNGTATATGTGTSKAIAYTPNANYNGADSFIVEVTDGNGVDEITVNVTITSVNDAPIALDDTASTYENTPVTIYVLANDSDIENDTLTLGAMQVPAHGNIQPSGNSIIYTPNVAYIGSDSFEYRVSDGNGGTATATVHVTVSTMDDDGVDEDEGVDGNADGIEDRFQSNVASQNTGTHTITLASQSETTPLTNVSATGGSIDVTLSDDTEITLPYGTVSFTVTGLSNGGTANIELYFPYDESIIGYAKQFADGSWRDAGAVVTHSSPDYTKVTFDIVDGSDFDLDGVANGEVKDPGGAYRAGASAAVAVPLSPFAKAIMALLFALGASLFMRRKTVV